MEIKFFPGGGPDRTGHKFIRFNMLRERAGCQQANGMGLCDDFGRGLEARRGGEGGSAATNGALFYSLHRIRALPTAGPRGTIATFTHTLSFSPSLQPPPPPTSACLCVAACLPTRYIWTNITWHVMPTQRHSCTPTPPSWIF